MTACDSSCLFDWCIPASSGSQLLTSGIAGLHPAWLPSESTPGTTPGALQARPRRPARQSAARPGPQLAWLSSPVACRSLFKGGFFRTQPCHLSPATSRALDCSRFQEATLDTLTVKIKLWIDGALPYIRTQERVAFATYLDVGTAERTWDAAMRAERRTKG